MKRSINRQIASVLVTLSLWVGQSTLSPSLAQTCASNCSSQQIQFTPGQRIRLVMVNRTSSLVQVEKVFQTNAIPLLPGQELEVDTNFGTQANSSIVFWDETSLAVRAVLSRPDAQTLRIELLPGQGGGDRSVFVQNDGRVAIF